MLTSKLSVIGTSDMAPPTGEAASSSAVWSDDDSRVLAMQIALKSADLGSLGHPLEAHKKWGEALAVLGGWD